MIRTQKIKPGLSIYKMVGMKEPGVGNDIERRVTCLRLNFSSGSGLVGGVCA